MRKVKLFVLALFSITASFGQSTTVETSEGFQGKVNQYQVLVEKNCLLIKNSPDQAVIKKHTEEIRKVSKELLVDVENFFECNNPNFGYKLAMGSVYTSVAPGLGAFYYSQAFVDDECPDAKSVYTDLLRKIKHLAWRAQISSKMEKVNRYTAEMLELKDKLASL